MLGCRTTHLHVHFSTAQLLNLPGGQLRDGQVVEVKSAQDLVNGLLFADSVAVKAVGIQGNPGDAVALQGITRVVSADTFEVNGQPVRITPDTVFDGGTADDIAVDMRVEVEGFFDADDLFVAIEIEFLQ